MNEQNVLLLDMVLSMGVTNINKVSKIKLVELYKLSESSLRLYVYIYQKAKTSRKSYLESQLMILEPNISGISRNGFFNACKDLVLQGILVKVKPKHYAINPLYINVMSGPQIEEFNKDLMELSLNKHFGL